MIVNTLIARKRFSLHFALATCGFALVSFVGPALASGADAFAGAHLNTASEAQGLASQRGSFVSGEVLVRFKSGVEGSRRAAVLRDHDARIERSLPVPGLQLVRLAPGTSVRAAAASFKREPEVLYAEPNFLYQYAASMPNDARFGALWGLHNTGQTVNGTSGTADADIDAPEAWDTTTGSAGVAVAVVDSGVAYDHPDLAPNIWTNSGESGGGKETNDVDDDGNGLVDDWRGWDFVSNDNDPRDFNGHGTHVAGTIGAAGNNGAGVVGVNSQMKLMPLRAGDASGSLTTAAIVSAFSYAGAEGAQAVNASFGGGSFSHAVLDAINAAPNTLFVAAAGNGGGDGIGDDNDASPQYPCNYAAANVVCVAATNQNDAQAGFSNYGANSVDLGAPGVSILSTQPAFSSVYNDGFETDTTGPLTTGGTNNSWQRTSEAVKAGIFSLADSPGSNYLNGTNSWARTTNPLNLAGRSGCRWDKQVLLDTERDYDFMWFEASTNAITWTTLSGWSGSTGGSFFELVDDLSAFDGQSTVYLRVRLESDNTVTGDGVHIDETAIGCLTSTYSGNEFAFEQGTSMAAPHVAGAAALVWSQIPSASVAEVKGRLLGGVDLNSALAGRTVTGGRLNVRNALQASAPAPVPTPIKPTPPGATPAPVGVTSPTSPQAGGKACAGLRGSGLKRCRALQGCRKLRGKKRKRCVALARCTTLKSNKRKRCARKASRIGRTAQRVQGSQRVLLKPRGTSLVIGSPASAETVR